MIFLFGAVSHVKTTEPITQIFVLYMIEMTSNILERNIGASPSRYFTPLKKRCPCIVTPIHNNSLNGSIFLIYITKNHTSGQKSEDLIEQAVKMYNITDRVHSSISSR